MGEGVDGGVTDTGLGNIKLLQLFVARPWCAKETAAPLSPLTCGWGFAGLIATHTDKLS